MHKEESQIVLLVMGALADLRAGKKSNSKAKKAKELGPRIIAWFRQNPDVDVDAFVNMQRKGFASRMAEHFDDNSVRGFTAPFWTFCVDKIEKKEKEKKKKKSHVYDIGKRFMFWESQRQHPDYIEPKYPSMKDEMFATGLMNQSMWDELDKKVETKFATKMAKKIESKGYYDYLYNIGKGRPFDKPHLRALILYTDFTDLCKRLCAILRDGDPLEVAEIAHWTKLLTETVQCFGRSTIGKDSSKIFYRGVNKAFVFRMIVCRFHLPQSTTSSVTFCVDDMV